MPDQNSSISNFSRFFVKILLPLVLIISGAGVIFNYFFEKKVILKSDICGAYKVNRIITEDHADEIPIFGSSRAAFSFIPDSLGDNYFNYGLAGTKTDVMLFFLEQECRKAKTRPWIMLNFDLEGLTDGLGDISNYILNADDPGIRKLLGNRYRKEFAIPLIKYYGRYESYLRSYLNDRIDLTKVTNKGAALEKNEMPKKEFDQLVADRRNTATIFVVDTALQEKLLSIINSHPNRYFVFVVSPYHSSFFEKFTNVNDAYAFLNFLGSHKNVRVFDFSRMSLSDSMFLNTTHINYKGALIFNHVLKDSLTSIGMH